MIVIVDYGMGNIGSIANIIKKVGGSATVGESEDDLRAADKLILPGVGAFDHGMESLAQRGYDRVLTEKVLDRGTPILGICLGMQLMGRRSEEGHREGLGWFDAESVRFRFEPGAPRKIPHMGWNTIEVAREHPVFPDPEKQRRFYFVHSYHVCCRDPADVLAVSRYGREFTSAVARDNITGVQFHPEKSHRFGMELMDNFVHRV